MLSSSRHATLLSVPRPQTTMASSEAERFSSPPSKRSSVFVQVNGDQRRFDDCRGAGLLVKSTNKVPGELIYTPCTCGTSFTLLYMGMSYTRRVYNRDVVYALRSSISGHIVGVLHQQLTSTNN